MSHPKLAINIKRIGPAERHEFEAVLTRTDTSAEISANTFIFSPDLLLDKEPQWMLDKAIPRRVDDALRGEQTVAEWKAEQAQKLAIYGQRLYRFLFGDGQALESFLKYNDAYARSAHLTLALHSSAAALWRLPWEYIHDGHDFMALHGHFQLSRRPHELGDLARQPGPAPPAPAGRSSPPQKIRLTGYGRRDQRDPGRAGRGGTGGPSTVQYLDDATLENIGAAPAQSSTPTSSITPDTASTARIKRMRAAAAATWLLENENGTTQLADIAALRPHLHHAPDLRLAVLSGCQTAQTSAGDAFSGVATGMLAADIPAIVAMQFSILDNSAIQLARAFYTALARGDSLVAAMAATRLAFWQYEDGPGYDWGVPALYLRVPEMRFGGSSKPRPDRSRRPVRSDTYLDQHRRPAPPPPLCRPQAGTAPDAAGLARQPDVKSTFMRGIGGIGKSSPAAKLAQRPGRQLDGIWSSAAMRWTRSTSRPKLPAFCRAQGEAGHAEAGMLLLNAALEPAERVRRAAQLISGQPLPLCL